MGAKFSEFTEEQKEELVAELFQVVQSSSVLPDIGIDDSIVRYSGLYSAYALDGYSSRVVNDLVSHGPSYIKELAVTSASLKYVPNAVGLGALILSIILDIFVKGIKKTDRDGEVLGMMRRVFAEEKASSVRDVMDEYIKRFRIKMLYPESLLSETKRLEQKLSSDLTKLRNSMLYDNQMNSRSMKYWTNGAAFHVQMVIHEARMEVTRSWRCSSELDRHVVSISQLADQYGSDLERLLPKYETYKRSTIYTDTTAWRCNGRHRHKRCYAFNCGHHDKEFRSHVGFDNRVSSSPCRSIKNIYLNYLFKNWNQPRELREYFSTIKQNLRMTIMQNNAFTIQKFLPASTKKK